MSLVHRNSPLQIASFGTVATVQNTVLHRKVSRCVANKTITGEKSQKLVLVKDYSGHLMPYEQVRSDHQNREFPFQVNHPCQDPASEFCRHGDCRNGL